MSELLGGYKMAEIGAGATDAIPKKRRGAHYRDREIIAALKATNGLIYRAAARLGCAPTTIYRAAEISPAIQQTIDDARGELLDAAEAALMGAIGRGEAWAVCFTLKTLGKGRGYIERAQIEHGPQRVEFVYPEIQPVDYRQAIKPLLTMAGDE